MTVVAIMPILGTVYQTLVLTDLADDVIRRGIESDSRDGIWLSAVWGLFTIYGVFGGLGLSKKLGIRNTILLGTGIFILGNFLCGMANSFSSMLFARGVEGVGKGMVIILVRSYLYAQFDQMLLSAVLLYGSLAYATRGTSPLIAAMINEALSWRWIYWINIPLGFVSMSLIYLLLPYDRPSTHKKEDSKAPKPDILFMNALVFWLISLLFVFGWNRELGGLTSNTYTAIVFFSFFLFLFLVIRLIINIRRDNQMSRIIRSKTYLCAMSGRMLLLLHLAAVLGLLSKYMVNLRGYPRETAGWVYVPVTCALALSFWMCAQIRHRDWRHLTLVIGGTGTSASVLWLSQIDLATPGYHLSLVLTIWAFFLGMLPASFLIDEVECMRKEDMPVAGAFAIVCLAAPLIIIPALMSTAVSNGSDDAFEAQRRNIRSGRPVVGATLERSAILLTNKGFDAEQSAALSLGAVGAMVKLQSTAMGIQGGLRMLGLATGFLGAIVSLILLWMPGDRIIRVT
jgi:MFS family permease